MPGLAAHKRLTPFAGCGRLSSMTTTENETTPIEPEAEPLTDREPTVNEVAMQATIDRLTERVDKAGWLAEQDSCTIERLTRERDEALEQVAVWKAAWAELARKQGPIA